MELGTETMKMARIAGIDYAKSTDYMTATLRGFNLELNKLSAQRVNDVYSELAAVTASDTQEIAEAMTKTASIASSAGMSLEVTATLLAKAIETTREAPENIGTAMKTVVARFSEMKKAIGDLVETSDGEVVSVNRVEQALRSAGVELRNQAGEFRSLDDVFLELSQKWDTLDIMTQRYIATQAAGSRQQSRFIAMLSNYARTQELLTHAQNSAGASNKQYEKTMESLEAKLNRLKNAWDTFTMDIAKSEIIKGAVDVLTNILTLVNNLTDSFGSLSGAAKLGAVFIGFKLAQPIITGLTADFVNLAKTLGQTNETRKGFEKGLAEGFKGLREKLFDKATWISEGEKAGLAAGEGVKIGVEKAAQEINAAQVAKESLTVQPTISKESLDSINKYQDALKKITKAGTKFNGQWQQSGETLKNLAKGYTKNGEAIRGLTADNLRYFKYYRSAGISIEKSFIAALDEQAAETIKNVRASNMLDEENQKLLKSTASAAFQRNLENKTIQKNTEITQGNTLERKENAAVTEEQVGSKEANIGATETESKVTEESTIAQKKNNEQTELGILNKAKYSAQLLFGNKAQREGAAASLNSAGANKKLTSSFSEATFAIGKEVAIVAALVAVFKLVSDVYFLNEKREKELKKTRLENVQTTYEETDAIKDLQSAYAEASDAYEDTIESKIKYKDATAELAKALGIEIKASDLLAGNIEKINKQLQEATKNKYEASRRAAEQAKQDAEDLIYDAQWNMKNVGAFHGTALSKLSDLSFFMYGKQSYDEYEEQLKESQEALDEAEEKLKEYGFKEAYVQSQLESGITTNAQTFEQYKEFRSQLEENLKNLNLTEEEIQTLLSGQLSNSDAAFDLVLQAEEEFRKRIKDSNIQMEDSKIEEFLKEVREKSGTSSLANVSLIDVENLEDLKEAYNLAKRIKDLSLGEETAKIIEGMAAGEAFDSFDEETIRNFNNELLQIEGVYSDIVTAQKEWNDLLAKGGSEAGKLKYLLKLQSKVLEKRIEEKENLSQIREEKRRSLKDEEKRVNKDIENLSTPLISTDLSRYLGTGRTFGAQDILQKNLSGLNFIGEDNVKALSESVIDTYQQVKNVLSNPATQSVAAYGALTGGLFLSGTAALAGHNVNRITNSFSENVAAEGMKAAVAKGISDLLDIKSSQGLTSEDISAYLENIEFFTKDNSEQNLALKEMLGSKYDDIYKYLTEDLAPVLKDYKKYLDDLSSFNLDFDSLDLDTKYELLELEQIKIQEARIAQATFSTDNLKEIGDLMSKARSGEGIGELSENIKSFLELLPSMSGGYANALDEYLYSITYKSSQEIERFFKEVSNAGIEELAKSSQRERDLDKQELLNLQKTVSTIEEDWGDVSGFALYLSSNFGVAVEAGDSLEKIMSTIVNLSDEERKNLSENATSYQRLIKNADTYVESQKKIATLNAKLSGTNYSLKTTSEYVAAINSNIDNLTSSISDLSTLLAKIGEGFTLSAEDAREFAKVFPEILQNATVATDGTIQLNEAVVQSFINGKKEELDKDAETIEGQIDNQIAVLDAKIKINEQERADFEDNLGKKANLDTDHKRVILKSSDLLYEHIRNSGAQEVVDNNNNLRIKAQGWSDYLTEVSNLNKNFYSNLALLKKYADKGIDINNLNLESKVDLKVDYTGKPVYSVNGERIGAEEYSALQKYQSTQASFTSNFKKTTLDDVLANSIDIDELTDDKINELYDAFIEEALKEFEKTGKSLSSNKTYLEAAKTNLLSSKNLTGSLRAGTTSTGTTETSKFENTLDVLYNLLQNLETLEEEYERLLQKRNVTGKEIYENLKAQVDNLNAQQKIQKQIAAGRQNEISQIFKNTPGLSNYVSYNSKTGEIQVNQTAINSIVDKEYGDKILSSISDIEKAEQNRQEAIKSLHSIDEQIAELKENQLNKYVELENRTYEALKQHRQKLIDNLSEINSNIIDANSQLMETVKDNINKLRQDRQNEKSENEIANLQGQLSAMAVRTDIDINTSKEYLDLQKSLKEKTESYQDTLIDQKLAAMEEDNKKAQEQREAQIKLLERHLEVDEKTGILMNETQKLISDGVDGVGKLINHSDLMDILKSKDGFEGMSQISKMNWTKDIEQLVAEGFAGLGINNQLESYKIKSGTKVNFMDGSGRTLTGTVNSDGSVKVTSGGKSYTYNDVFKDESGQYRTFETTGAQVQSTTTTTSKAKSSSLSEKDYYGVALATINGSYGWGSGDARISKYKEKGFDPDKVQSLINTLIYDSNALSGKYYGIKDLSAFDYKKYAKGGMVDYTGFAWLDGTRTNPEAILNAAQSRAFIEMVDNYRKIANNVTNVNDVQSQIEVNIHIDEVSSDYDVQQMVKKVKEELYDLCTYRNDNTLNYLR